MCRVVNAIRRQESVCWRYIDMFLAAVSSATSPLRRAAVVTESARVLTTVTFHTNNFLEHHGICVIPFGRLPSRRVRPTGSFVAGTPANTKARDTRSFSGCSLAVLLGACLQTRPCWPRAVGSHSFTCHPHQGWPGWVELGGWLVVVLLVMM